MGMSTRGGVRDFSPFRAFFVAADFFTSGSMNLFQPSGWRLALPHRLYRAGRVPLHAFRMTGTPHVRPPRRQDTSVVINGTPHRLLLHREKQ